MEPFDPNRKTVGIRISWVARRFPGNPGNWTVFLLVGFELVQALHPVLPVEGMVVQVLVGGMCLVEGTFPVEGTLALVGEIPVLAEGIPVLVEELRVAVEGIPVLVGGIPVAVGGIRVLGRIPAVQLDWDRRFE